MRTTVALIANTSWYLYNFRSSLMKVLVKHGYSVVAIAPEDSYSSLLLELGVRYKPSSMNRRGRNPYNEIKSMLHLYKLLRSEKPDIILTYTPKPNIYGSLAARALALPTINNIAGLGHAFVNPGLMATIVKIMYRIALRRSQKVFFQNKEDMEMFLRCHIISADLAERIPGSGVNTTLFSPDRGMSGPSKGFKFILIGRMLADKGVGEYVKAARIIRKTNSDVRFCLLGPVDEGNPAGIPLSLLERWSSDGLVEYLGTSDAVVEHLADADCVVLPSYYREGVPRSLLEAASMAKPIITTAMPGCRDVVDDGVTGFLCRPRDVDHLVSSMQKLLYMPSDDRIAMGRRGREKMILEFDEHLVVDRYLDVIENVRQASKFV